jgi:hypothetical protein
MRFWIKLYTEIVHDPKMAHLTDRAFRVCINLFALAGITDQAGALPAAEDVAWQLRMDAPELKALLDYLADVNILEQRDGVWYVRKWQERQAKPPSAHPDQVLERVHKFREKQRNEPVTPLHSECNEGVTSCNEPVTRTREEKRRVDTEKSRTEKSRDTNLDHPAVIAYRDAMHLTPNATQRKLMAEAITDTARWTRTLEDWLAHGWKPTNVPGIIERYRGSNGSGKHTGDDFGIRGDGRIRPPTEEDIRLIQEADARAGRSALPGV